eukprot:31408-Pelagococcus_subviridis.AAC.8
MFNVAPLKELRWLNALSPELPPFARDVSHPANARETARWSDAPPASFENPCRASFPASLFPSIAITKGDRYAAAHATVSTGSNTPNNVAYRSILPTRGCTGISPRWRPKRVSPSSSFNAPMSWRSVTACAIACGIGGSTACSKKFAVDPAPAPTAAAPPPSSPPRLDASASIRTCRQSSSSGERCISGSWKSANAASRAEEYSL